MYMDKSVILEIIQKWTLSSIIDMRNILNTKKYDPLTVLYYLWQTSEVIDIQKLIKNAKCNDQPAILFFN